MEAVVISTPRAIDPLGRIVVPAAVRVLLGLAAGGKVVFVVRDGVIMLRRADTDGFGVTDQNNNPFV